MENVLKRGIGIVEKTELLTQMEAWTGEVKHFSVSRGQMFE